MSELTNIRDSRITTRWKLLTGVSVLTLGAYSSSANIARAEDTGQPSVWIELGGQFWQQDASHKAFLPPFVSTLPRPPFETLSPASLEKASSTSYNGTAKVTFEPAGTDWIFSAGILFGKNTHSETRNEQTAHPGGYAGKYNAYWNIASRSSESHTILDFQAGKDVGLGMFGHSVLSVGVRYGQLKSESHARIASNPTNEPAYGSYNHFYGVFSAKRKFSGIGPAVSWDASANLAGDPSSGRITLDWGVNGGVLFGKQTAQVHHQTSKVHVTQSSGLFRHTQVYQTSGSPSRNRQVVVPNLGGFAGVSWKYANAKVSFGYRADMFFGAIDGGIETRKTYDRNFYGPFATISIGLGG